MFKRFAKGGVRNLEDLLLELSPPLLHTPEGTRPCTVDGSPALFHRFVDQDRGVLQINRLCRPSEVMTIVKNFNENNFTDAGCNIENFRQTKALIEWPDGRLCTVEVERVQFTDRQRGG